MTGLAVCLQLCALLLADPIPEQQLRNLCVDSDITVTVDNKLELHIDGTRVTTGLTSPDTWGTADTVHVPAATRVIGIKGVDVGVIAGILASGTYYTTDHSWKCSNVHSEGWAHPNFDDSAWPAATEIDANGASPWGTIAGISSDAKWIWTEKFTYGPDSDKTVYCRKKPGNLTVFTPQTKALSISSTLVLVAKITYTM